MKAVVALVAAAGLIAAAGCARKPASWKEWLDEAPAAFKAEQYDRALEQCGKAFDYALAEKSGPRAIGALECMAEAGHRAGRMEAVFPAFEIVLRDYDNDLRISGAGLRLRNNYAAALVDFGRKEDGMNLFDETLDAYEGTPERSKDNYRVRMQLVANLARTVRVFPDSAPSIRVSTDMLAEILNHVENARFRNNLPFTLGTANAMAAIAELIRLRGDPKAAEELLEKSREQQVIEDELLDGQMRRIRCEPVTVRSLVLRSCYAAVP